MGKARIFGRDAVIKLSGTNQSLGELDKFSAKKIDELKTHQALGEIFPTANVLHKGWELSFEGNRADWDFAALMYANELQITGNNGSATVGRAPTYTITETITYYNGKKSVFIYYDVVLHSPETDMGSATDEVSDKVSGFSPKRVLGSASDTEIKTSVTNAITGITAALAGGGQTAINVAGPV